MKVETLPISDLCKLVGFRRDDWGVIIQASPNAGDPVPGIVSSWGSWEPASKFQGQAAAITMVSNPSNDSIMKRFCTMRLMIIF